ncbi:PREDICTED: uncharacterized protein LOC104734833 [Camelina sativa]|uniref:Uncharacterized protein LOC104734833 n=1 Tax=Camelina sativa TaxID=90675 RepID=A0ABM0V950_CAMSA|nr:PREDICTED: uncharacterized protein LOC104734833 [Camelina sativa]
MESANILRSDEDCRSCESGWTMYLASQSHDHNHDGCYYDDDDEEEEEDSDGGDSMDSDASSGPMEATCLKLAQEIEEQNSVMKKKKKTNEEMVLVETTRVHNNVNDDEDDIDGDNHDYDDANDSYSVVHSYVGSVRQKGLV